MPEDIAAVFEGLSRLLNPRRPFPARGLHQGALAACIAPGRSRQRACRKSSHTHHRSWCFPVAASRTFHRTCCHHSRTRFSWMSRASARRARLFSRTTRDAGDSAATRAASRSNSAWACGPSCSHSCQLPADDHSGWKSAMRPSSTTLNELYIKGSYEARMWRVLQMSNERERKQVPVGPQCTRLV